MKILVCYASAGQGHRKAAEAIYDYLLRKYPESQIEIIDALKFTNTLFEKIYSDGYLYLISRFTFVWGLLYYSSIYFARASRLLRFLVNRLNTAKLAKYLLKTRPDVIISTHFLVNEVVDFLIKHKNFRTRLFCVITDFSVHPYWIFDSVDTFIVGLGESKDILIRAGIDEGRILPVGIPVAEAFYRSYDRDELREKMGLRNDEFVVLVLGGAAGIGPIEKIVEQLHNAAGVIVVCGYNDTLLTRLKRRNFKGVILFGFVDNIYELMVASDVLVTKPGGLSVSEAIALRLPMIFISPLPGQETGNIEILSKYNVGILLKSVEEIKGALEDFKNNPERIKLIRENLRSISNSEALKEIYNEIRKSCSGDTSGRTV